MWLRSRSGYGRGRGERSVRCGPTNVVLDCSLRAARLREASLEQGEFAHSVRAGNAGGQCGQKR